MSQGKWEIAENIDLRIKSLAHILGGQAVLAELYGTTQPQVSRWIQRKAKPQKKRLEIMAKSQGWPLSIFEEAGPMPADIVKWPREMMVGGGVVKPDSGANPETLADSSVAKSLPLAGPPDAVDRPMTDPFAGLPEPAMPKGGLFTWNHYDLMVRGCEDFIRNQHRRGLKIDPADAAFWVRWIQEGVRMDVARAEPVPPENGEHAS